MPEPTPPPVTIQGGPVSHAPPKAASRKLLLGLVVGLAALTVVVAVAQGSPPPPPAPDCPEPCLDPTSVVLGAALPLTGVLAPFGQAQQQGVELAVERVNAGGGVDVDGERRQVELLVRDTRSVPDVAGQAALILVRGPYRLTALLAPCAPPVAMVRVAESRQVPLLTGCQPLPQVGTASLRHTWEIAPAEADRARAVIAALRSAKGQRVGLFLSNDRSDEVWRDAAEQGGLAVTGTYRPQGSDWAPAVQRAVADRAELVVAVTQPPEGVGLWRELDRRGVRPELAYASEAGLGSAWYAAVGRAADGTLTDSVHPPSTETGPRGPRQADDAVAAVAFELTQVLVDAVRRAGSSQRSDVNDALVGTRGAVAGREVRFSGDHTSRVPHELAVWRDGRLVPVVP